ncbi:hypothetical protein CR513_08244, partial [Mucuna pruriens]
MQISVAKLVAKATSWFCKNPVANSVATIRWLIPSLNIHFLISVAKSVAKATSWFFKIFVANVVANCDLSMSIVILILIRALREKDDDQQLSILPWSEFAIKIAENLIQHDQTKHVEFDCNFIYKKLDNWLAIKIVENLIQYD